MSLNWRSLVHNSEILALSFLISISCCMTFSLLSVMLVNRLAIISLCASLVIALAFVPGLVTGEDSLTPIPWMMPSTSLWSPSSSIPFSVKETTRLRNRAALAKSGALPIFSTLHAYCFSKLFCRESISFLEPVNIKSSPCTRPRKFFERSAKWQGFDIAC